MKKHDLDENHIQILEFISLTEKITSKRDIAKAFRIKGFEDRIMLKQALRELVRRGLVEKISNGYIVRKHDQNEPDLLEHTDEEKIEYIHGVMDRFGQRLEFIPLSRKEKRRIHTVIDPSIEVNPGDVVKGKIYLDPHKVGRPSKKVTIHIIEVLERSPKQKAFHQFAVLEHDLPHEFSKEALKEANSLDAITNKNKDKGRKDLTNVPFITIDGEDAKDFDDAVWAEPRKNGWYLMVAIADVAAYIKENSPLDKEAFERGNSTYLPNHVIPMLPERLSNDLCSLNPHEEKASFVVHMNISKKGELESFHFERAIIRSHARTTYEQIQEFWDTGHTSHPDLTIDILKPLFGAYEALLSNRHDRGVIELDLDEIYIIFNKDGMVETINNRHRLSSHRLIEEFMVTANIAAAKAIDQAKKIGIYRVHEKPNEEKIHHLQQMLQHLKVERKKIHGEITPNHFNAWLKKIKGTEKEQFIQDLILRAQSQAKYQISNLGHFGLGLKFYTHFTSPIRRYSDLIVHRLLAVICDLNGTRLPKQAYLEDAGAHLSMTERRSDRAERDTKLRYLVHYLESQGKTHFEGRISGVMNGGLFVMLDEYHAEGFLPKRLLPRDRYVFDDHKLLLKGLKNHTKFQMGDKILVRVYEISSIQGNVIFELDQSFSNKKPANKPPRKKSKPYRGKKKAKPKAK